MKSQQINLHAKRTNDANLSEVRIVSIVCTSTNDYYCKYFLCNCATIGSISFLKLTTDTSLSINNHSLVIPSAVIPLNMSALAPAGIIAA